MTFGAPFGATGCRYGSQSGTESRSSTLMIPLNRLLIRHLLLQRWPRRPKEPRLVLLDAAVPPPACRRRRPSRHRSAEPAAVVGELHPHLVRARRTFAVSSTWERTRPKKLSTASASRSARRTATT